MGATLIERVARAIRSAKYVQSAKSRRTEEPSRRDVVYAAAAVPALLYALADITARQGRLSSKALIRLAHEAEKGQS